MSNNKWGVGTNYDKDFNNLSYGYPESDDPRFFYPDRDVCTSKDFNAWVLALKQAELDKLGDEI